MSEKIRSSGAAAAMLIFCCSCSAPAPVLPTPTTRAERSSAAPKTPAPAHVSAGSHQDFDDAVAAAKNLVETFWFGYLTAQGIRYEPAPGFVAYDSRNPVSCGTSPLPLDNASYCSAGDFVAFDRDWLRGMYVASGEDAVYVVIPHEFGHAAQARLGIKLDGSVRVELQADCFAGVVVSEAVRTGSLPEEPGDAEEMFAELAAAADTSSTWWLPDTQGTATERQYAFQAGVLGGVTAC